MNQRPAKLPVAMQERPRGKPGEQFTGIGSVEHGLQFRFATTHRIRCPSHREQVQVVIAEHGGRR